MKNPHRYRKILNGKRVRILLPLAVLLIAGGCARRVTVPPGSISRVPISRLQRMGYSIQVGAFSKSANAVRLTKSLKQCGLDAYYFVHASGLYKVRFGNFSSREAARRKAEQTTDLGKIDDYYIVSPEDYAVAKYPPSVGNHLRKELVKTAESYIGLPYQWGGSSPDEGFDCSGLAMAVYQLNGLQLPRLSRDQYNVGVHVSKKQLKEGDLVFFKTASRTKISHVGIYAGGDRFIHAPGKGKKIRIDSLSNRYYTQRYAGARTYLW